MNAHGHYDLWLDNLVILARIITDLVEWVIIHGLKRTTLVYGPYILKTFQMDHMATKTIGEFERHVC